MKILITGAKGTIGSKLVPVLEDKHELCLLSRICNTDDDRWHQVDLVNLDQVLEVMQGIDIVIHLAIATGHEGDYEDDTFNRQRFDVNVKGTYNLFEASQRAGVKKVIYTSSLTVVWGYLPPSWVGGDVPAKPVGTYALTKHRGEQIAVYYSQTCGLCALCLRIPKPIDIEDPDSKKASILPQWIAFPDLVQAYELALETHLIGSKTITVVGESSKRRWDLSLAEKLLGYSPQYRLEELGYSLREEPSSYSKPGVVIGQTGEDLAN